MPSSNIDFATLLLTITPKKAGANPLAFRSEVVYNEGEILGDIQLKRDLGERFMAGDGESSTTVHNYARNGQRDLTLMDGDEAEALQGFINQNPIVHFDFDFQYYRVEQDASKIRIQRHRNCFIRNLPVRVVTPDGVTLKFTIDFEKHQTINAATGLPVGT
jgi:hypothetical protein